REFQPEERGAAERGEEEAPLPSGDEVVVVEVRAGDGDGRGEGFEGLDDVVLAAECSLARVIAEAAHLGPAVITAAFDAVDLVVVVRPVFGAVELAGFGVEDEPLRVPVPQGPGEVAEGVAGRG